MQRIRKIYLFFLLMIISLSSYADNNYFNHNVLCSDFNTLKNIGNNYGCHIKYGSGGVYLHYYDRDFSGKPMDKVVLIAGGFDPEMNFDPEILAKRMQLKNLSQRGYSVIIATFHGDYSRSNLKDNAYAMSNAVRFINMHKASDKSIVVAGYSLGGLMARAALTILEDEGYDHQSKTFISIDSPHKGALMPLSIQYAIKYFQKIGDEIENSHWSELASIAEFLADAFRVATFGTIRYIRDFDVTMEGIKDQLAAAENSANFLALSYVDGTASKQLLINHYSKNRTTFNDFYNWLHAKGDYPSKTRNVAFTNGSVTRRYREGDRVHGLVAYFRNEKNENPKKIYMRAQFFDDIINRSTISDQGDVFDSRATFKKEWYSNDPEPFNYDGYMPSHAYSIEGNTPGSYMDAYKDLKAAMDDMNMGTSLELKISNTNRTFIPTYSSLGLDQQYANVNLLTATGNNIESISPFDKIYYHADGQSRSHGYFNDEMARQVQSEISLVYVSEWLPPILSILL